MLELGITLVGMAACLIVVKLKYKRKKPDTTNLK